MLQQVRVAIDEFLQGSHVPKYIGTKRIFIEELIRHGRERQKKTGND